MPNSADRPEAETSPESGQGTEDHEVSVDWPLAALADLPAAVLVYRRTGEVVYLNQRARGILLEILGRIPDRLDEAFGRLPTLGPSQDSQEWVLESVDGRTVHVGFKVKALGERSREPERFVLVFQDITSFVEMQRQRDRYLRISSMSHLLPTIAHQILNPLAGIQSLLEVVLEESESSHHREDLRAALANIGHIGQLVRGLGLAGRDLATKGSPVDLTRVVGLAVERHVQRAAHYDVELSISRPPEIWGWAEPDAVWQVASGLVDNALQACAPGDSIRVELVRKEAWVELVVSDTGQGMDPATLERATEPFFTTRPRSSGIGLTLAAEVAESCGGRLELRSEPDKGSTVSVLFPAASAKGGARGEGGP